MPEKIITVCHICMVEAVALMLPELESNDESVMWCSAGHVTVIQNGFTIKVYDFNSKVRD
jgi:hypothetical protein